MSQSVVDEVQRGEPLSGYVASAVVFAGITALWAFVVRDDPYYRFVEVGGVRLPLTTIVYLTAMPALALFIGMWRYDRRHQGGALSFAGKLVARGVHFVYAHSLLVLFTVAMATDYFLGLNLDDQIRSLDDGLFDFAARYAPWLAAYLAGFNLGRALRIARDHRAVAAHLAADDLAHFGEDAPESVKAAPRKRERKRREQPMLGDNPFQPAPDDPNFDGPRGELGLTEPPLTSSGLPHAVSAPIAEHGFLPPQDLSKLRPSLNQLR